MLRFQGFKNSKPQLAHTNPAKNGLLMPASQLYAWCLNNMRKRLVIQLLFVSEFMTIWFKVPLYKLNLQTLATYSYVTLAAQKMPWRVLRGGGIVTPSAPHPAARPPGTSGAQRLSSAHHCCTQELLLLTPEWLPEWIKEEKRPQKAGEAPSRRPACKHGSLSSAICTPPYSKRVVLLPG